MHSHSPSVATDPAAAARGARKTVAIVDDHSIVRGGLELLLADSRPDLTVVYNGPNPDAVLRLPMAPDLVLLDLDLGTGPVNPDDVAIMVRRGSAVLVVSAMGLPSTVRRVVDAGVCGLISKADAASQLIEAVDVALSGEQWHSHELAGVLASTQGPDIVLTEQESNVLTLYAEGLKIAAVAHKLHISPETVKTYLKRIRRKFADADRPASSAADLYREAFRAKLINPMT